MMQINFLMTQMSTKDAVLNANHAKVSSKITKSLNRLCEFNQLLKFEYLSQHLLVSD